MNNIDRFFTKNPEDFAQAYVSYLTDVLKNIDTKEIAKLIELLIAARENQSTIFFIGNGGSAATASHFANDLSIGTNSYRKPFRALSLTDNVSIITALGNDFGYDQIFVRQLQVLARPGDLVVGISASGNSPNLIEAFEYANLNKLITVGITSFSGGKMKLVAKHSVHVPAEDKEYGPAEDAHMMLDHLIGAYLTRFIQQGNESL